MIAKMGPFFGMAVAALQFLAAIAYFSQRDTKRAALFLCGSVANTLIVSLKVP